MLGMLWHQALASATLALVVCGGLWSPSSLAVHPALLHGTLAADALVCL